MSSRREQLIDAAEACFARLGIERTTVDDVAREAGVSRATVYRYVRDRDDLVLAALEREAVRFGDRLVRTVGRTSSVGDAVVEGIVFAVREVGSDPGLGPLFGRGQGRSTASIPGAWDVLFRQARSVLAPLLDGIDLPVDEVVEWVLRTVLSLLTVEVPVERTEDELRAHLRRFLPAALVTSSPAA